MRKKGYYKKRERPTDAEYNRVDVGRFISYLMTGGKKIAAEKAFYGALKAIGKTSKEEPIKIFEKAMENASPLVEVRSRRVGGANYQIPQEIAPDRQFFLATHWIINAARSRKGKPIAEKLAEEFLAAAKNEGAAIKKKQDTHRMAEANRAFASFLKKKR